MTALDQRIGAHRDAIDDFLKASDRAESTWTTPRAPGKWSPSQLLEHVARALDAQANTLAGRPSNFPKLPGFLRPLARAFLFNRVLASGTFPKAKTNKAMNPDTGPATPAEGRARLTAALEAMEKEARACGAKGGVVDSGTFGRVSLDDYLRFSESHVRHHLGQLPQA